MNIYIQKTNMNFIIIFFINSSALYLKCNNKYNNCIDIIETKKKCNKFKYVNNYYFLF